MPRRLGLVVLVALALALSGCATAAKQSWLSRHVFGSSEWSTGKRVAYFVGPGH